MGKFDAFNQKVNLEEIQNQMKEAKNANGTGDFEEVPSGKYDAKLVKMEVGTTGDKAKTPGAPLLKVDFKILGPDHKNQHLFLNKVLYTDRTDDKWNMGKLMKNVIGWLDSLQASEDIPPIKFEDYDQFSDLILDIAEDVSDLEYVVRYDPDEFNAIEILEVYE